MGKAKAILKTVQGVAGYAGAIGTMTGTGLVHIVAGAFRVRIPSGAAFRIARVQWKMADEAFRKAREEWKETEW